jgi:hypothetical protein
MADSIRFEREKGEISARLILKEVCEKGAKSEDAIRRFHPKSGSGGNLGA